MFRKLAMFMWIHVLCFVITIKNMNAVLLYVNYQHRWSTSQTNRSDWIYGMWKGEGYSFRVWCLSNTYMNRADFRNERLFFHSLFFLFFLLIRPYPPAILAVYFGNLVLQMVFRCAHVTTAIDRNKMLLGVFLRIILNNQNYKTYNQVLYLKFFNQ